LKIISSRYTLIGNKIEENIAVAFSNKIEAIGKLEDLKDQFPTAEIVERENTLLMAGLINAHIHLEFSKNSTELNYGNFVNWLNSVIEKRTELVSSCETECIETVLDSLIKSGTTAIGAISSYGFEFEALKKSPIRKVIFNELIGSQPHQVDALWQNFLSRLEESSEFNSDRSTSSIAIHSPYSVHPILIRKAMEIATKRDIPVSTHFMESQAEREWLDSGKGDFKEFFEKFFNGSKPVNSAENFLNGFSKPIAFTHCNYLSDSELQIFKESNHTVSHCPRSNRLLGSRKLDINKLDSLGIEWNISTDGLSSNSSLSLWDELQTALYLHSDREPKEFAFQLLKSVTEIPAKQLNLNSGKIDIGRDSDLLLIDLKDDNFEDLSYIPLHLILRQYRIEKVFIGGDEVV